MTTRLCVCVSMYVYSKMVLKVLFNCKQIPPQPMVDL